MTQDFYSKAQNLHEEFQKKELQYLHSERKLSSTMMWKRDLNLPLQEYLERINQREKETEESYKSVMKQMDDLDQHTNTMYLKLEKLKILQNSTPSLTLSSQSFSLGSNLQVYDTLHNFNIKSSVPQFESTELNKSQNSQSLNTLNPMFESKSVSTQTENIYCANCSSLLNISSQASNMKNLSSYVSSAHNNGAVVADSSKSQTDYSSLLSENQINSKLTSSFINGQSISQVNKNFIEISELEQKVSMKPQKENLPLKVLEPNGNLITENSQSSLSENKEMLADSQLDTNKNFKSKSTDSEGNEEGFILKSYPESMNSEFDFLESDTAKTSSNLKDQNNLEKYKSPPENINLKSDKVVSSGNRDSNESTLKHEKDAFHPNLKLAILDDKSETSGSVSGPHSPNVSVGSDSDSVYEKGSPLTASAAYQALLGNTVITPKAKKIQSESESEDEIENVLADAVQKTHVKSRSSLQLKKDKSASQPVDSEPSVKGSKPPVTSNPQSKLSKNTRKVLGLDTSSGSEVEMSLKPPGKKTDEDSDEFDFYD